MGSRVFHITRMGFPTNDKSSTQQRHQMMSTNPMEIWSERIDFQVGPVAVFKSPVHFLFADGRSWGMHIRFCRDRPTKDRQLQMNNGTNMHKPTRFQLGILSHQEFLSRRRRSLDAQVYLKTRDYGLPQHQGFLLDMS